MPTPGHLVVAIVEALKNVGLRGILVKGWGNLSFDALENALADSDDHGTDLIEYAKSNVLFIDKAPHEWLLSRCSCSVHHGGAGTTAAAMRAGVPTIVAPLGYDQPVHGDWVERLGVS